MLLYIVSRAPSSSTSRSVRPTPSTSSFASTIHSSASPSTPATTEASASIFRNLNFTSSLPLEIALAPLPPNATGGPTIDRSIEKFYLQVPRNTYLPLLLPTIKKQFLSLVMNSTRDGEFDGYKENDVWFENAQGGQLLKSHWPIGLLYDYYHATQHHSLPNPPTTPSASDPPPSSLTSIFAPLGSPSLLSPPRDFISPPPLPHDPNSTLRGGGSSSNHPSRTSSNSHSTSTSSSSHVRVAHPHPQPFSSSTLTTTLTPWHLILHLSPPTSPSPFVSDFEFNSPSPTECKKSFMARYKEGDYVRFGNSKKRLVNLKREEQDQLWDGVVQNDFQKYWSIANKLIPLPLSTSSPPQPSPSPSIYSGAGQNESTLTVNNAITGDLRNLAVKVYLPPALVVGGSATGEGGNVTSGATGMGGRILTCPVTPLDANGQPTTLQSYLSSLLPLLFPPQTPLSSTSSTSTFTSSQNHRRTTTKVTAYPLIQGIVVPLESELNWLASCMGGTDGWVSVVVAVFEEELTEGQD